MLKFIDNKTIYYGDFYCNGNKIKELDEVNEIGKTIIESGTVKDCLHNIIFYYIFSDNTGVMFSPQSCDYGDYHVEKEYFKW